MAPPTCPPSYRERQSGLQRSAEWSLHPVDVSGRSSCSILCPFLHSFHLSFFPSFPLEKVFHLNFPVWEDKQLPSRASSSCSQLGGHWLCVSVSPVSCSQGLSFPLLGSLIIGNRLSEVTSQRHKESGGLSRVVSSLRFVSTKSESADSSQSLTRRSPYHSELKNSVQCPYDHGEVPLWSNVG